MSAESSTNRIDSALQGQPPGLWPFIPAGYPDLAATKGILERLNDLPIRGIELGFPFSDPIADGPVIQEAFSRTLANGIKIADIFVAVASARRTVSLPLLAMVSASIVYRVGPEAFITRAREAGFDGLIIPDLSLEEAPALASSVHQAGLRLAMLVAPTTPPQRQKQIAATASGFLYYVSIQGTTGERSALPFDLSQHVRDLRAAAALPVLVGFGISTADHVRQVCGFADGAIIGSAITRKMTALIDAGLSRDQLVEQITGLVAGLAAP